MKWAIGEDKIADLKNGFSVGVTGDWAPACFSKGETNEGMLLNPLVRPWGLA